MKVMDSPFEVTATDSEIETFESAEFQLSDNDKQRWIWAFERLKSADIGLSFSEKAKAFCDATTPEEIERFIEEKLHEQSIIPLAA